MCMWLFGSFQKFICSWTLSFFQHVLNRQHLLCVINSLYTFWLTFFKRLLWTYWRCECDFLYVFGHFSKNVHVVELRHLSSMSWIGVINSSPTLSWHSPNLAQSLLTHWRCACDFLEVLKHFFENFTFIWTKSFFQHVLNKLHLPPSIDSFHHHG
jgi:hypothetical protein